VLLVDAELENGPHAAGEARRAIAMMPGELPGTLSDDVILMVSELVTNSFRHAGMTTAERIGLRVTRTGERLRVEVLDPGRKGAPGVREGGEAGGWGLHIVETLAHRWGTTRGPSGMTVWFEMNLD
jgi:anti-sigma regulatory factor (Ser/Thr protein kinase)